MKKILLFLTICLLLASCGGGGGFNLPANSNSFYSPKENLYAAYPSDWMTIEEQVEDDKLVMGYFSMTPSEEGYFGNLTLLKEDLQYDISSKAYARDAVEKVRTRLLGYKKEVYELYTYNDGNTQKETYIHVFTGKDNFQSPEFRYVQTYYTHANQAYVQTYTLPLEETDIDEYIVLSKFTGFSSKDPFAVEEN